MQQLQSLHLGRQGGPLFDRRALLGYLYGSMFAFSFIHKLLHIDQVFANLFSAGFGHDGSRVALFASVAADVTCAMFLLTPGSRMRGCVIALATLFVYSLYLTYLLTLAAPPPCGCGIAEFFESAKHNAVLGLFRNSVLMVVLILLMRADRKTWGSFRTC